MNKFVYIYANVLLILLLSSAACAQAQGTFTVMTYNCENVFDTIHDEGKDDLEFTAGGDRHWHRGRLADKLRGIAKVIVAADEHRPVDLVGLCEVENDSVMAMLAQRSALAPMGYKYVMTHSADPRGVDVALLYSPFTFHPFETQSIASPVPTRDILRVSGIVGIRGDTLDVYVVHLPSKLGGRESMQLSMSIVRQLQQNVDSALQRRSRPNIIAMGDFNAEPRSRQLKLLTRQTPLVDVAARVKPGTYKYQGAWSIIDHVLCHTTALRHAETRVLVLPSMLEDDLTNGGKKPRRTYLGPVYKGGISDHLPVVSRFLFE